MNNSLNYPLSSEQQITMLTAAEAAWIVNDCGARALISSYARREVAALLPALTPQCRLRLITDDAIGQWLNAVAGRGTRWP
jgi:fatty-acyl-CoA synthase